MRKANLIVLTLAFAVTVCRAHAQTPPCGKAIVRTEGPKVDERFVAAPPEQVKIALLKATPALGAKVHKDEGLHIETEDDMGVRQAIQQLNKDSGLRDKYAGLGALGKIAVDIQETTKDGEKGSLLHIEFHRNGFYGRLGGEGYSQPLAEETVCLVKLLSTNDPVVNPRGLAPKDTAPSRGVALPEGTAVKVLLRDPLYSKKLDKNSGGQTIPFEVAEDVVVDGVTLVRRGALATAHLTELEKAKGYGRHAQVQFAFDGVTAVDGQKIPLTGGDEKARGGRHNNTVSDVLLSPALSVFMKGSEVFIRAGTGYDLEVSGQHTVQTGN